MHQLTTQQANQLGYWAKFTIEVSTKQYQQQNGSIISLNTSELHTLAWQVLSFQGSLARAFM